jgi:glycosyltransferase 2 family protein
MNKIKPNIFIKYCISITLVAYFILSTDVSSILKGIKSIPLASYSFSLILYFVALSLNALKWKRLLNRRNFVQLYKYVIITQYYSLILPGGVVAGELVKAYKIGKGEKDAEKVAASIIVDRITGFLGLIFVGYMGLLFSNKDIPNQIIYVFTIALILLLAVLFSFKIKLFDTIIINTLSKRQYSNKYIRKYLINIKLTVLEWKLFLDRPVMLIESIIIGILFQLAAVYMIYILALGSHVRISFQDLCWIYSTVSIIVFIPISVAGLGLREGGFIALFAMISLSPESALVISLSIFSLQIFGGIFGAILEIKDHKNITSRLEHE